MDAVTEELVATLNDMYAGAATGARGMSFMKPNLAQRTALHELHRKVALMGPPPPGLSGQGALAELLAKRGYDGEPATLAPLHLPSLALPRRASRL